MTAPIADLATTENLLVVADFDGTLAGITTDPYNVPVNLDSLAALTWQGCPPPPSRCCPAVTSTAWHRCAN